MTFPFARLAQKWVDTPLMIDPGKAAVLAEVFGPRVLGGPISQIEMGVLTERLRDKIDPWTEKRIYQGPQQVGGVAVICIEGTLVDKGAWQGEHSGMTSYEGLSIEVEDARTDDAIKAVAFEVDSPGGLVDGCFELADEIFALSMEKPTVAILTPNALSAAYLLASACGAIVVPESGAIGSIGAMAMYVNALRKADQDGFDVQIFTSAEKKADGHPLAEQRDGFADDMTALVMADADRFAGRLERYRGDRLTKQAALDLRAGILRGEAAVAAGLADMVAAPRQAFAAFVERYG